MTDYRYFVEAPETSTGRSLDDALTSGLYRTRTVTEEWMQDRSGSREVVERFDHSGTWAGSDRHVQHLTGPRIREVTADEARELVELWQGMRVVPPYSPADLRRPRSRGDRLAWRIFWAAMVVVLLVVVLRASV